MKTLKDKGQAKYFTCDDGEKVYLEKNLKQAIKDLFNEVEWCHTENIGIIKAESFNKIFGVWEEQ